MYKTTRTTIHATPAHPFSACCTEPVQFAPFDEHRCGGGGWCGCGGGGGGGCGAGGVDLNAESERLPVFKLDAKQVPCVAAAAVVVAVVAVFADRLGAPRRLCERGI